MPKRIICVQVAGQAAQGKKNVENTDKSAYKLMFDVEHLPDYSIDKQDQGGGTPHRGPRKPEYLVTISVGVRQAASSSKSE